MGHPGERKNKHHTSYIYGAHFKVTLSFQLGSYIVIYSNLWVTGGPHTVALLSTTVTVFLFVNALTFNYT